MSQRFDYVKYDQHAADMQGRFKQAFLDMEGLVGELGDGRAKSLVLTKLEEAYMWVGKAIRDDQIARGGDATDEPHRTNE